MLKIFPKYLNLENISKKCFRVLNVILFIKQNMLILYCLKFTVLFKFFSFGSALRNELLHEKSRTEHVIYILQYLICVPNALMSVMM